MRPDSGSPRLGSKVIAFERPGQGSSSTVGGLTFDNDLGEAGQRGARPLRAESAGLVGISMGGYWALRAAGREPRIDWVVCWPPVYDWPHRLPAVVRGPDGTMLRRRRLMRWSVRTRARLVPT
jgi:pimeloyl-ACP methyl ester carboxylesterase